MVENVILSPISEPISWNCPNISNSWLGPTRVRPAARLPEFVETDDWPYEQENGGVRVGPT